MPAPATPCPDRPRSGQRWVVAIGLLWALALIGPARAQPQAQEPGTAAPAAAAAPATPALPGPAALPDTSALCSTPAAAAHIPGTERRELNRAESQLRAQLLHLPREEGIELLRESDCVILRVPARVLFAPDSDTLKSTAAVTGVLALPERLLRKRRRLTARIEVYTDNIGGSSLNQTSSQQRAQALLAALRRAGIALKRLQAVGEGLRTAIASNDTPEGRMRNRRVEFVFERAGTRPAAPAARLRPEPATARAGV